MSFNLGVIDGKERFLSFDKNTSNPEGIVWDCAWCFQQNILEIFIDKIDTPYFRELLNNHYQSLYEIYDNVEDPEYLNVLIDLNKRSHSKDFYLFLLKGRLGEIEFDLSFPFISDNTIDYTKELLREKRKIEQEINNF